MSNSIDLTLNISDEEEEEGEKKEEEEKSVGAGTTYSRDGETATLAAYKGDLDTLNLLIAEGRDINAKNKNGETATMMAAGSGHLDTLQWLVKKEGNIKAKDNDGWTATMHAAGSGQLKTLQWLVEKGGNIKAINNDGWTATMLAAGSGNLDTLKWLVDTKKGDILAKDKAGKTALDLCKNQDVQKWIEGYIERNPSSTRKGKDRTDDATAAASFPQTQLPLQFTYPGLLAPAHAYAHAMAKPQRAKKAAKDRSKSNAKRGKGAKKQGEKQKRLKEKRVQDQRSEKMKKIERRLALWRKLSKLSPAMQAVYRQHQAMMGLEQSKWFNAPVNPKQLNIPTYPIYIKKPMDLGTIKKKLANNGYESPAAYAADVRLVFANCMTFNPLRGPAGVLHKIAEQYSLDFEKKLTATLGGPVGGPVATELSRQQVAHNLKTIPLSVPEKEALKRDIEHIQATDKPELLQPVIDIIVASMPPTEGQQELDIELDNLAIETARQLQAYVASTLKKDRPAPLQGLSSITTTDDSPPAGGAAAARAGSGGRVRQARLHGRSLKDDSSSDSSDSDDDQRLGDLGNVARPAAAAAAAVGASASAGGDAVKGERRGAAAQFGDASLYTANDDEEGEEGEERGEGTGDMRGAAAAGGGGPSGGAPVDVAAWGSFGADEGGDRAADAAGQGEVAGGQGASGLLDSFKNKELESREQERARAKAAEEEAARAAAALKQQQQQQQAEEERRRVEAEEAEKEAEAARQREAEARKRKAEEEREEARRKREEMLEDDEGMHGDTAASMLKMMEQRSLD